MTSPKVSYVCTDCGYKSGQWMGKCNSCESWNSLEQIDTRVTSCSKQNLKIDSIKPARDISISQVNFLKTNIKEFDSIYNGGLPDGSLTLIGGEPGSGKSSFLLFIIKELLKKNEVLYITAEETSQAVVQRAKRLDIDNSKLDILASRNWNEIRKKLQNCKHKLIAVDSIQALFDEDSGNYAGSSHQIKKISYDLLELAKVHGFIFIILSQVTKDGSLSGPKSLEHLVDISFLIKNGSGNKRILTVEKNRFGCSSKKLYFNINKLGNIELETSFDHKKYYGDNRFFSYCRETNSPIEVEVLLSKDTDHGKISTCNFDISRLNLILMVLDNCLNIKFDKTNIFLNIISDKSVKDKNFDLAIIAALINTYKNKKNYGCKLYCGEVTLSGRLLSCEDEIAELAENLKDTNLNIHMKSHTQNSINEFYRAHFV